MSARMVIPLFSAQTPRPHPTPSRSTSCWPQPTASQSYPSGLPLHGPGASPPALPPPRLPFLHLEDACGWTGWSQAGAAPSLTQAPRPLTDPNAACPAPAARRTRVGGGCQGGGSQRATCPRRPGWLNSTCDSVGLSGPLGGALAGDVSGQVCGRGFSEVTQAPELPSPSCRHSGQLSRAGSQQPDPPFPASSTPSTPSTPVSCGNSGFGDRHQANLRG